jgi:hypothetical protein
MLSITPILSGAPLAALPPEAADAVVLDVVSDELFELLPHPAASAARSVASATAHPKRRNLRLMLLIGLLPRSS